jgi:hypothetical protein
VAGTSARNRRLLSVLACAFVALMSTLVWPAPAAQAHTELKSSVPSAGARLAAAPQQVRLLFNEKVTPGFSAMTLKVADGPAMTLAAREDGLAVTADVPSSANGAQARGGPIAWKVEYRVVADDGHPINGEISFAVTAAATTPVPPSGSASASTPATSSAPPANASAAKEGAPTGDAQRPVPLPLLVGGGLALAVGAAVWRIRSKPQQGPS